MVVTKVFCGIALMCKGLLSQVAAIIVKYFSNCLRWCHKKNHLRYFFCRFLISKGIKIALLITVFLINWCKDYSVLWHCGNYNLTLKIPQIFTRGPQIPDKRDMDTMTQVSNTSNF